MLCATPVDDKNYSKFASSQDSRSGDILQNINNKFMFKFHLLMSRTITHFQQNNNMYNTIQYIYAMHALCNNGFLLKNRTNKRKTLNNMNLWNNQQKQRAKALNLRIKKWFIIYYTFKVMYLVLIWISFKHFSELYKWKYKQYSKRIPVKINCHKDIFSQLISTDWLKQ